MPLYTFKCPDGHKFHDLFKVCDMPDKAPCPACGSDARRIMSVPSRFAGGQERLDIHSWQLLSPNERARRGGGFRSMSEVHAEERRQNVRPLSVYEERLAQERDRDTLATHRRIEQVDGAQGLQAHMDKEFVCEHSGMDSFTYTRWKDLQDAVERDIASSSGPADLGLV